jgi:hypothetical protein
MSPAPALNGEEEVERVARAIYVEMDSPCSFRGCGFENHAERYLRLARAAIGALAARRPATEAEEAVERVKALAEELDEDSANADPTSFVAKGWRDAARRIRATLTPAADGGDPP